MFNSSFKYFLSAIDLTDNLGRISKWLVTIPSDMAPYVGWCMFFPIMVASGSAAWMYDIMPTIGFTSKIVDVITPSFPVWMQSFTILFVLAFTLSPTAFELGGSTLARLGLPSFQWAVYTFSLFDLITDAPATTNFVDLWGIENKAAYNLFWVLWLVMSSFFFEMIFVITFIVWYRLISMKAQKAPAGPQQSAGAR